MTVRTLAATCGLRKCQNQSQSARHESPMSGKRIQARRQEQSARPTLIDCLLFNKHLSIDPTINGLKKHLTISKRTHNSKSNKAPLAR